MLTLDDKRVKVWEDGDKALLRDWVIDVFDSANHALIQRNYFTREGKCKTGCIAFTAHQEIEPLVIRWHPRCKNEKEDVLKVNRDLAMNFRRYPCTFDVICEEIFKMIKGLERN